MATTSNEILRHRILVVLAAYEGSSRRRRDVLDDIDEAFHGEWTPDDLALTPEAGQVAWRVNASWERNAMRADGLLREDAGRVWALTPAGSTAAEIAINTSIDNQSVPSTEWTVPPGATMGRDQRMRLFGGAKYGGIEPSRRTQNIFVYSDPRAGKTYGYNYDGWSANGSHFLYTGEGRHGDQRFKDGNRAILEHLATNRALRLFVADGTEAGTSTKIQLYIGQFEIDADIPFVRAEALDVRMVPRSVIVFRLRPIGPVLRRESDKSETGDIEPAASARLPLDPPESTDADATAVPPEAMDSVGYDLGPSSAVEAVRREAILVDRYTKHLIGQGHEVGRWRLRPAGELRYLYTDVMDFSSGVLYEAKAAATRNAVRMAVGQLLDYRRHVPNEVRLAVLLPTAPSGDLLSLLHSQQIDCTYEDEVGVFQTAVAPTVQD